MVKLRLSVFGADGRMGKEVLALAKKDKSFAIVGLGLRSQVVIDFSSADGALEIAQWCSKNKVPLVSGTTGLSPSQFIKFKGLTKKIPTLLSPNFSLGLNAMVKATETFLKSTNPMQVTIEEVHHKNKKDNPSGTAKFLATVVKDNVSSVSKVKTLLGLRMGNVFGLHKVTFSLDGESISFIHEARDRKIFAQGSLVVAKWLVNQRPGFYRMSDFIESVSQ